MEPKATKRQIPFNYDEVLLLLDTIPVFNSPPPHVLHIYGAIGGASSEANV